MKTHLQKKRQTLAMLLAERDLLRKQYGAKHSRAKILDPQINEAAKIYAQARKEMLHITLAELRGEWGKKLGWDETDWN